MRNATDVWHEAVRSFSGVASLSTVAFCTVRSSVIGAGCYYPYSEGANFGAIQCCCPSLSIQSPPPFHPPAGIQTSIKWIKRVFFLFFLPFEFV